MPSDARDADALVEIDERTSPPETSIIGASPELGVIDDDVLGAAAVRPAVDVPKMVTGDMT